MTSKPLALAGAAALCGLIMTLGCGDTPPFNSYDPPPTFAFEYILQGPNQVVFPLFDGSTLSAEYQIDIVGTPYVPLGNTRTFGPQFVEFSTWTTVQDGRWPADWEFTSESGCGIGTVTEAPIEQKLNTIDCVPKNGDPTVSPTSYNSQRTTYLTVNYSDIPIPAGTVATYRFVDAGTGSIEEQDQITFNGGTTVVVAGPNDVPDGLHYLTFDFAGNGYHPDGYDDMYTTVTTTGYNCIPRPGHSCL